MSKKKRDEEENKKKARGIFAFFGKRSVRLGALYVALFGLSTAGAYWFTPYLNGSLNDDYQDSDSTGLSNTDRFMSKLTELSGFKGTINTLKVSFPDNDNNESTHNEASLKSGSKIIVAMPDTEHIGFHLDTEFTLSTPGSSIKDVTKPIFVNYDSNDLYISMLGAKYKYLAEDYETILDNVIEVLGKDGVTIPSSFYETVEKIFGGLMGGSSDGASPEIGVNFAERGETKEGHAFVCTVSLDENDYDINMTSDDDFNLTSVQANLDFGSVQLDLDLTTDLKTVTLGSLSQFVPEDKDSYVSLVNMHGVFKKIAHLASAKAFDVSFDGALTYKYGKEGEKKDDALNVSAFASLDIGESDYRLSLEAKGAENNVEKIDLAYLPSTLENAQTAYLNYNDVYKVSASQTTIDALIGKVKDATNGGDSAFDAKKLLGLFSFLTDSEVMNAIAEGHYQSVLNMIDDLQTSNDKIVAGIELKGLGFGENAKIVATIDGHEKEGENALHLLKVEIKDIALKDTMFNGVLTLDDHTNVAFKAEGYNSLEKLPDIYDQVSDLANEKRAGLGLDANIRFDNDKSVSLRGSMQFDANASLGTGSFTIEEPLKKHLLTTDFDENQVHLQYQDADANNDKGTLAKLSIRSVQDLVSYISSLTKNERFQNRFMTPFGGVIGEVALSNTLSEVLDGRYSSLLGMNILKNYTFSDAQSVFTINAKALGLDKDLRFAVNYGSKTSLSESGEVISKVDSLELLETDFNGVKVGLKVTLKDYDASLTKRLSYAEEEYNDFSSVSDLTKALLNTITDFDTYHVKASCDVTLWTANIIHLDMDMLANYTNQGWEYYLKLSNIPLIPAVNSQYSIFYGYTRSVEVVVKDEKVYLLGVNPFGKHGYLTEEDRANNGEKIDWTETNAANFSFEYLQKNENLLKFMLGDLLNVQPYYLNQIKSSDSKVETSKGFSLSQKLAYEKVLESTSFDSETSDYSMTLNIGALLNSDYVVKATLGAKTNNDNYLTQVAIDAFAFAGVRVDFSLYLELMDVGQTMSESLKTSFDKVVSLGESGTTHSL